VNREDRNKLPDLQTPHRGSRPQKHYGEPAAGNARQSAEAIDQRVRTLFGDTVLDWASRRILLTE
jgi:hypothetical protein